MRLTDDVLRKVKRPTSGQQFLWDDLVTGFGVRLTPTRTSYVVQWRTSSGSRPRESLKRRWPATSVIDARDVARHRLAETTAAAEHGADLSLRHAMRAWFERESVRRQWRPRYRAKVDATIRRYVEGLPPPDEMVNRVKLTPTAKAAIDALGGKAVSDVTRSDVLRVADHIKRGAAEQFLAFISVFFNDAAERGWNVANPARNRLRVTGGRIIRSRILSDPEFLAIWRAFELEADPNFGAFQLLCFTGARRREVTSMRRNELNLEAGTWTLPPERRKTGRKDPTPFVIRLHPAAVEIIRRQPVLEGSPYVFWGRRDRSPFDFQKLLLDRVKKAAAVTDWRLHDLRRYMRSGLGRLGISQTVGELCLGHVAKSGLVGVYDQHQYLEEKLAAWQRWGDHLVALTSALS
ncbi:MAG: tyrosine-type recombinase/integrase [Steroidobacteraceae bacterium]